MIFTWVSILFPSNWKNYYCSVKRFIPLSKICMSSYLAIYFYTCELEIRLKFTDGMQGHLHTSSDIQRFVLLIYLFLRGIYTTTNNSSTARSKRSHNKSPLTATENITAFIVRNSCVSTAVAYDFIHGPIYCVTAPLKRHKFCFCFITLCFSKRRVAWRPSLKPG